jgi:hypothetical protein
MDDASLCRLIQEALHDPNRVEALALAIDQLPKIKADIGKGWQPYYDKALPVTMRDIQRNINRFRQFYPLDLESVNCQNPAEVANVRKCFIKWVVIILKRDCQNVSRSKKNKLRDLSISDPIDENENFTVGDTIADNLTLTGIKRLLEQERLFMGKKIKRYLEEDPERKLRNCHPRNSPHLNCQVIAQKLLIQEPSLNRRQLARELEVPEQTVYTRWNKYCLPLLLIIAKELGCE